jgi:hypothetical protein
MPANHILSILARRKQTLQQIAQICQETGKEQEVQVLYDEGLAHHIGPEPCGGLREEADEKSVGGHVGGVWRRESCSSRAPTLVGEWKATSSHTRTRVGLGLCAV